MNAGIAPARQTRSQHRHQLRSLTYACLEQANGGIVRDINHFGVGLQVVAAVRAQQQVRVRFELSRPRLRVETRGEVTWATRSGQCGIRFLDLPPKMVRQIDEWILGNLLEGAALHGEGSMFAPSSSVGPATVSSDGSEGSSSSFARSGFGRPPLSPPSSAPPSSTRASFARSSFARSSFSPSTTALSSFALSSPVVHDAKQADDHDGLMVSSAPVHVIELPTRPDPLEPPQGRKGGATSREWLALTGEALSEEVLSEQTFSETVLPKPGLSNSGLSGAGLFDAGLSEPGLPAFASFEPAASKLDWLSQPLTGRSLIWTINTLVVVAALLLFIVVFLSITGEPPQWPLAMAGGGAIFVAGLYWGFFRIFGGSSPGARLARMAGWEPDEREEAENTRFR